MEKLGSLPSSRERSVRDAFSTQRWKLRTTPEERALAADFVEGFNAARLDRASVKAIPQQTEAAEAIDGEAIARRWSGGRLRETRSLSRPPRATPCGRCGARSAGR